MPVSYDDAITALRPRIRDGLFNRAQSGLSAFLRGTSRTMEEVEAHAVEKGWLKRDGEGGYAQAAGSNNRGPEHADIMRALWASRPGGAVYNAVQKGVRSFRAAHPTVTVEEVTAHESSDLKMPKTVFSVRFDEF